MMRGQRNGREKRRRSAKEWHEDGRDGEGRWRLDERTDA